jgi:Protein of unknown function (DUF2752)
MENVESFNISGDVSVEPRPLVERVLAGAGAVVLVGGAGAVAYFDPSKQNFFPICPLLALTGFACPGCGLTRGFHALIQGDLITAIDFNALIFVWAAILGWVTLSLGVLAIRGRGLYMWPMRPRFMYAFMISLITFGVLRNIPAWPLTILYP